MSFTWTGKPAPDSDLGADELEALGLGREFGDRTGAEEWLTENFPDLADAGVESVSLFDDGTLVYGPMSLGE
ncbi:MAG: hypothetical protein WAX29_04140 [Propionibacterium sp.]